MHACSNMHTYILNHTTEYACTHAHIHMHTHICTHIQTYTHMHPYKYTYIGIYMYACVCIYRHMYMYRPYASVVHASGSGQLQANPHVAGSWLPPGKPTRKAVTTMGSNDLVVGEDHMLGPSCQRYNWQMGRCRSMAFGSSLRRGKTLISNLRCLAEVSTLWKRLQEMISRKNLEWSPYRRFDVKLWPLSGSWTKGEGNPHR